MATTASQLVQFLMSLFNSQGAAQSFLDNPHQALSDAGLGDVGTADVYAVMPVVLDYAPISVSTFPFDRENSLGRQVAWSGLNDGGDTGSVPPQGGEGSSPSGHDDDHVQAVQQLQHMVNNYSYTATLGDWYTVTDQPVNQNIWASDDVQRVFDIDTAAAVDHAMTMQTAAYDAFNAENSIDDSAMTDRYADIESSFHDESEPSLDSKDGSTTDWVVSSGPPVSADVALHESFDADDSTDDGSPIDDADSQLSPIDHAGAIADSHPDVHTETTDVGDAGY